MIKVIHNHLGYINEMVMNDQFKLANYLKLKVHNSLN